MSYFKLFNSGDTMVRIVSVIAFVLGLATLTGATEADAQNLSRIPVVRPPRPGATSVPELDPTAAGAALALLVGGAAVLYSGRRKQA